MNYYSLTDTAIEIELGRRLREHRLRRNRTQQQLADAVTLSVNSIKALEQGKGKLSTLIAVLRELQLLDQLDNFLPDPGISPLQLARNQGRIRRRATGKRGTATAGEDEPW